MLTEACDDDDPQAVLDTATSVFPEAKHVTRWILGGHSMVCTTTVLLVRICT